MVTSITWNWSWVFLIIVQIGDATCEFVWEGKHREENILNLLNIFEIFGSFTLPTQTKYLNNSNLKSTLQLRDIELALTFVNSNSGLLNILKLEEKNLTINLCVKVQF